MTKKLPIGWRPLVWGLALTLASVASGTAQGRRSTSKMSPKAREAANAKGADKVELFVRFKRTPGTAERSLVQGLGGQVRRHYRASRWMALRLPARAVERMADNPDVEFITIDAPVSGSMDVARETAGLPPASVPESALKGAGVTVAMVDSGVATHPELTLVAEVDLVSNGLLPILPAPEPVPTTTGFDPNGHGTHVAGIIAGDGSHSPQGRLAGVAPQAGLVSVRVLQADGHGSSSDVLAGLHWVADHKDQYGIRVLNLSLGHPIFEAAADDPLVQAVDALWDAGVVVVCAAGNRGRDGTATINSPCNSRKVITVGALNDMNTADPSDDVMATYSSQGPTRVDLVAKPDIIAPGNRIVSLRAPGSFVDTLLPERRVAADPLQPLVFEHFEMSGTSMAAPMVAGTVALMLEQDPALNPATVKARLMLSARKPQVGNPFATGAGALDILAALRTTSATIAQAPSPRIFVDTVNGWLGLENTALLWADPMFSLDAVWSHAAVWANGTDWNAPVLWSTGVLLWSVAELWTQGDLWTEADLWSQADLWTQGDLWTEADLWSQADLWTQGDLWTEAEFWTQMLGLAD